MLKAVLIDMDDTLLRLDTQAFTRRYLEPLAQFIIARTKVTLDNYRAIFGMSMRAVNAGRDPLMFNSDTMNTILREGLGTSREDYQAIVDEFMAGPYLGLRDGSEPMPGARHLVEALKARGLKVVVATNPLFVRVATHERLRWADIDPASVDLITTAENMHFVKPSLHYYQEILARLGLEPEEALMAGDDLANDIAPAAAIGLATFHVRRESVSPSHTAKSDALALSGTLADLERAIGDGWPPMRLPGVTALSRDSITSALLADVAALHGVTIELTEREWQTPLPAFKRSPLALIAHLIDRERSYERPLLMRIATEDNPFIPPPADESVAVERPDSLSGPDLVTMFAAERAETLSFLASLSVDQWRHPAQQAIFGPTTLQEMAAFLVQHDRLHLARLSEPTVQPLA